MQLTGSGHHQTLLGSRNEINLKFFTDSESHTTIFSVGPTTQTNAANTSAGAQRKAPGRSSSASKGFFSPHDLYSNGRFLAGTEPDPILTLKTSTLPQKCEHEQPSSRGRYLSSAD